MLTLALRGNQILSNIELVFLLQHLKQNIARLKLIQNRLFYKVFLSQDLAYLRGSKNKKKFKWEKKQD